MIIKHNNTDYRIINVETVASNKDAGRNNLVASMKKHKQIATLWIERPRGKKLGLLTVFENGAMSRTVTWM